MYFELTAPNQLALHRAFWEAESIGLDPEWFKETLTFSIGTGNIEKVSRIRDKFNLKETYLSESRETGYTRS
jgi:hypothetical protein